LAQVWGSRLKHLGIESRTPVLTHHICDFTMSTKSCRFTHGGRVWFCAAVLCFFAALAHSLGVDKASCRDGDVCDARVAPAENTLGSSLIQQHATISTTIKVHSEEVVNPPHCTCLCENLESSPWPDATNADAKAIFVEDCLVLGHPESFCLSVADEAWKHATADARFLDSSPKQVCAEITALVQAHEAFAALHNRAAALLERVAHTSANNDKSMSNKQCI